jgi:HTH domain
MDRYPKNGKGALGQDAPHRDGHQHADRNESLSNNDGGSKTAKIGGRVSWLHGITSNLQYKRLAVGVAGELAWVGFNHKTGFVRVSVKELATKFGVTPRAVQDVLSQLRTDGRLIRIKGTPRSHDGLYQLSDPNHSPLHRNDGNSHKPGRKPTASAHPDGARFESEDYPEYDDGPPF